MVKKLTANNFFSHFAHVILIVTYVTGNVNIKIERLSWEGHVWRANDKIVNKVTMW